MTKEALQAVETLLGITFKNSALLETALTHSSFARRDKKVRIEDNERLEFFGDAVLKLIVSEYLFRRYPTMDEGTLTTIRSHVISDRSLAVVAQSLSLGEHMQFSYGERNTGGAIKASNLANVMEAILGAYYLDQGLPAVKDFFIPLLERELPDLLCSPLQKDHKTLLQETLQRAQHSLPSYSILEETGPDHEKEFKVEARTTIQGVTHAQSGKGKTKKDAEQSAAQALYRVIHPLL